MAVAFDAKATTVTAGGASVSPITNATLTIGASGTLVIGVFCTANNTIGNLCTPTAMTWNSVAMSLIGHAQGSDGFSNVYVYGLISPTTGNHTCSVSFGTNNNASADLDCFSFKGTDVTSIANCVPSANVIQDVSTSSATNYLSGGNFVVTTASGDAACVVCNDEQVGTASVTVGTQMNSEGIFANNYMSLYNLAVGATTPGRFAVGGVSPYCGVAFRIIQPGSGDVLMSQVWL